MGRSRRGRAENAQLLKVALLSFSVAQEQPHPLLSPGEGLVQEPVQVTQEGEEDHAAILMRDPRQSKGEVEKGRCPG